ncbi:MAG: Gfo/Idh/MocA family oxidoreductase [Clostridia bacterium]|nr:Gfo/Idh/MocA family oxidoreductase [Clostridia bacterium]
MDRKLRMAVIGAGTIGKSHMRGVLFNFETELTAVCDPDVQRINEAAQMYAIDKSRVYYDYKEMLKRDDIDAVIVASPDPFHAEETVACLESGRDVLCEKPFALTLEDCKKMLDAEKRTGRHIMVGQVCRYAPGFVKAKELVESGIIGDIFYAETEYAHDYSKIPGKTVNGKPLNWRQSPLRHGVLGGGCHALDLIRWIAGNPTEVTAYANKMMLKDWPTDDTTVCIMKFPNGAIGRTFVSIAVKRDYTMRSCFYGSKGTIICDNTSSYITLYRTDLEDKGQPFTTPIIVNIEPESHNTKDEIHEFATLILEGKPLRMTAYEGTCTVALALAAVESSKTGKAVKIDYNF